MELVRSPHTSQQTWILHGNTDVGMVREDNQDAFCIHIPEDREKAADRGVLLVLADGMGGLARGALASQLAVDTIREVYYRAEGNDPEALAAAVQEANRRIHEESQKHPGSQAMGSTLTALALMAGRVTGAQVGDSRAYRISDNEGILQLTRDHTLVQELADRGEIDKNSIHYFLHRNVLTRGLGLQGDVEVDSIDLTDVKPGDTLLLCTDGLYDVVADKEIENLVMAHGHNVEELVDALLTLARNRGAPDNVTVVVARLEPDDGAFHAEAGQVGSKENSRAEPSRPNLSRSLLVPLSYFLVFAMGVCLTLLFEKSPGNEKQDIQQSASRILQVAEEAEYDKKSEGQELEEEVQRFLNWLAETKGSPPPDSVPGKDSGEKPVDAAGDARADSKE